MSRRAIRSWMPVVVALALLSFVALAATRSAEPASAPGAAAQPAVAPAAPKVVPFPAPATPAPGTPAAQPQNQLTPPLAPQQGILRPQAGSPQPAFVRKGNYKPVPPPSNFSPPILLIEQPDFDWGTVLQGEEVKYSYTLLNKGGAPLVVSQVRPSCGCTTAGKPEQPIPPGGSGLVTLAIDTKRFSGPVKKTADIFTNTPNSPAKVSIGGKVEPFFTLEPAAPRIDCVRGIPCPPTKITLRRNPTTQVNFKVTEVKTQSTVLKVEVSETQPGELYELFVTASLTDDPRKYYYEMINVKLDVNGKVLDNPINASITVKDRIDVQPRTSVYFSRNETKTLPASKTLDIKSLGGPDHTFQITAVETQTQAFETKLETVEPGKQYRLVVALSKVADATARTLREKIVLRTDDPTVKEIAITAMAALQ